jgi:hypothetical protein
MRKICLYCRREFEAESERVMFHDISCLDKYRKECITPIYEQTVKYNALSGEGRRNFSCIHYDTCLDGIIVRLEKEGKLKNNYQKVLKEWKTWHCPKDCNDFE